MLESDPNERLLAMEKEIQTSAQRIANLEELVKLKNPERTVSLSQRYATAGLELNGRIQMRQVTMNQFATVVFAFTAAILSQLSKMSDIRYMYACLCLPALGLVFTVWIGFQTIQIRLQSAFLGECEEGKCGDQTPRLPSWHSRKQGWQRAGMKYANIANVAYCLVLLVTGIPSLAMAITQGKVTGASVVGALVLLVSAIGTFRGACRRSGEQAAVWTLGAVGLFIVGCCIIYLQVISKFMQYNVAFVVASVLSYVFCGLSLAIFIMFQSLRYRIFSTWGLEWDENNEQLILVKSRSAPTGTNKQ